MEHIFYQKYQLKKFCTPTDDVEIQALLFYFLLVLEEKVDSILKIYLTFMVRHRIFGMIGILKMLCSTNITMDYTLSQSTRS